MEGCEFNFAHIKNVTFIGCTILGCKFSYATFDMCVFENCLIDNSEMFGSSFRLSLIKNSQVANTGLRKANMKGLSTNNVSFFNVDMLYSELNLFSLDIVVNALSKRAKNTSQLAVPAIMKMKGYWCLEQFDKEQLVWLRDTITLITTVEQREGLYSQDNMPEELVTLLGKDEEEWKFCSHQ